MTTFPPLLQYATSRHFDPAAAVPDDFVAGKSVFVVDVDDYDLYRSMLYALGAKGVANKMMAHVNLIVHGRKIPPQKARSKYPQGQFVAADAVLPLFHSKVKSFPEFVKALQTHGFRVRNPSDEGDPEFDFFELPLVEDSLHKTLLHYLATRPFIRGFVGKQSFPIDTREEAYVDFPIPGLDVTWYYRWHGDGWGRVHAQRGDDEYPLEIKAQQLMRVAPLLWKESIGMYFFEYPHIDSISGLFIQAGVDARTGQVNGAAISRVWT